MKKKYVVIALTIVGNLDILGAHYGGIQRKKNVNIRYGHVKVKIIKKIKLDQGIIKQ